MRDLMFKGLRTFSEFASSDEQIATNILTDRLARLEAAGILTKAADPADARRVHYRLTEKGIDLAPALGDRLAVANVRTIPNAGAWPTLRQTS